MGLLTLLCWISFAFTEYEGRVTLFSNGSLELRNVALSDTGQYILTILQATGPIVSTTELNIYEPVSNVTVTVNSSDLELVEFNSSVTLSCAADGTGLTFLWFNAVLKLQPVTECTSLMEQNFTIDPVWRYDQGPFTCNVSNPVSSNTSEPVHLNISYGPDDVILRTSPSDFCEEGSDVLMSCSADSRPAAQFKWFLNGELLSFTEHSLN
ncbi:hypothetical protein WMY93_026476 [Mugilogobius chulae]|uniref:Ig-like domain-containing protein n=1 Tax=Mugilogobius chulae TaxID=88201 RepID=A0AAW0N3B3_9GOBI